MSAPPMFSLTTACTQCGATPTMAKSGRCRECMKAYNRAYYLAHREHIIETNDAYYRRRMETDPEYVEYQVARRRVYRKAHAERAEAYRRKHLYGLTHDQYVAMFAAQGGRCAICASPHAKLHIDHDHATGQVRGLLCRACNHLLGNARDDADLLTQARFYLLQDRSEP